MRGEVVKSPRKRKRRVGEGAAARKRFGGGVRTSGRPTKAGGGEAKENVSTLKNEEEE